ncbi:MAG: hypothetical protein WDA24_02135 [Tissierellales bacterium]
MKVKDIEFTSSDHVIEEIRNMNVKGGSPFGRAAAWAYKLALEKESLNSFNEITERLKEISEQMISLKPTMATIFNTKNLVYELIDGFANNTEVSLIKDKVIKLCENIISHSLDSVTKLGNVGSNIIQDGHVVMMHSYSSTLMSIFTSAAEQGKSFEVICTESRPLRESRLAVKILQSHNIKVTYISDASIWEFMPKADYIIMGADTIAWDGSVANKMGTALISQLALVCKKPVYIASEVYKLDMRTMLGYPVLLERRTKDELIIEKDDFDSFEGLDIINQFFDLTPARNITALITEYGVIAPSNISGSWSSLREELLNIE